MLNAVIYRSDKKSYRVAAVHDALSAAVAAAQQ